MYNESGGILGGWGGLIAIMVVLFTLGNNYFGGNRGNDLAAASMIAANSNNQNNTIELIKGQQALQNSVNNNTISEIVNANNNNISQLQANYQNQMSQLGGFANLANQIAQQTSAMQLMGANLGAQQQSCCCETQKELIKMAGDDQLAICQQTNSLNNTFNNGLNQIRTDLAAIGYNINKNTTDIIAANAAGVQAIKDLCNNHWNQDLLQKYNDAKFELSQNQQTLLLTNQLNAIATAISKIPTTAAAGA